MAEKLGDLLEKDACLLDEGQLFETVALLRDAVDNHPANLDLKLQLAKFLSMIHEEDESEALLRTIMRVDPANEQATLSLGRLLDNSDRSSEAEREYAWYLKQNPQGHLIVYELCRMMMEGGRIEDAERVAKNHLDTHSSQHMAYEPLIMVLAHLEEEFEEAAIESNFKSPDLRRLLEIHLFQFDLLLGKERCAGSEDVSTSEKVKESLLRSTGEISHLLDRARSMGMKLPKKLNERSIEAVEEGVRRRKEFEID
jgi:thioredoxin-like negative regulator of GroEL